MKVNNFIKVVLILLFISFLSLYIGQATGYYEYEANKKSTLTKNAMKKFEKDLKEGKNLKAKNYLQEEKNYTTNASKLGINISNLIENSFNIIVKGIFNQIGEEINSK